jgi:hypothetical protein
MQYTNDVLIKELRKYYPNTKVKLMNENEVELEIEFVNFDKVSNVIFIKGYV